MSSELSLDQIAAHEEEWDKALGNDTRDLRGIIGFAAGQIAGRAACAPEVVGHYVTRTLELLLASGLRGKIE